MRKSFTTKAGTELPIISLKGKEYLEVKYRLVWFREEHPTWGIETDFPSVTEKSATAKATVKTDDGRIVATSHKTENVQGFGDFLEKAETGAIGRALALIGYGTQFCADELDEGERIVDSPVPPKGKPVAKPSYHIPGPLASDHPGDFQIPFGKFEGMLIKNIDISYAKSDYSYLAGRKNLSGNGLKYFNALEKFLGEKGQLDRPMSAEEIPF